MQKNLLLIFLICFLVLIPFYAGTYYTFLAIMAFIYIIISIGLNILTGYAGLFSLGHAGLVAMGAYCTAILSKYLASFEWLSYFGLHVPIGIISGVALSCLVGALIAYPSLRVRGPYLAMVTISFGWIIWKILEEWDTVTGGELGIRGVPRPNLGPLVFTTERFYYIVLIICSGCFLLQRNMVKSRYGRNFMAVKFGESAAASLGINIHRYKVLAFIISAFFAGLGGAIFAHQQNYVNPDTFHFFDSVFYLLAVLFGGAGTLLGPVIGSTVLTFLPEMLHRFDMYRLIIYGLIIIIILYLLPNGIWGGMEKLMKRTGNNPGLEFQDRRKLEYIPDMPKFAGVKINPLKENILKVSELTMQFGGLLAINNISLEIKRGSIHSIIGPNGAGKTTLLNLISGFYFPTTGKIFYEGEIINELSSHELAYKGIARTFQNVQLFSEMSVLENILIGFQPHLKTSLFQVAIRGKKFRREEIEIRGKAGEFLDFLGIKEYANIAASSLPYGFQRKVEIARALALRPSLLLLDEPAAGLNVVEINELNLLIKKIQQSGVTVILVEHHVDLVMNISDQISVLDYGIKIAEGSSMEIQKNKKVIDAYLGESDDHA